ncbi:hypothetical protein KVF89_21100 [Nocardioides carbamazepini]|uniref:MaoC/PaaZ C-terminal domain-containing protein n=1 Tax=Nocardioides carbamazepini TaxID=2854259 RepID=UPI00214A8949|nr:MaoC/PaaZ C-terminal domain-containing protein [Nocardioides carbamazepini]MCR1785050.1 hypothetical protein [Nocardioides carbamazepini]
MTTSTPAPGATLTRTWPAELGTWNRYAAVNDEFYPVHMDHEAARAAGMPAAFGMGNLQVAYFNALLDDWIRESTDGRRTGRVERLSVGFRSPSLPGSVVATASVTEVSDDGPATTVRLDLRSVDGAGTELCTGTAVIRLDG